MMKKSLRTLGGLVAVAGMLALAGCSDAGEPATEPEAPAAELSAEAQAAYDIVSAHTGAVDEFVAPGPAVDAAALEGKTVYFLPVTLQVPLLKTIADNLADALENVGADLQICDGKGNPSDAASCITQAIDADAAAVVTAGLTKEYAPAAFESLIAAGIPWVQGITSASGDEDPSQVAYVTSDSVKLQSWATNWVIADSDAKANVLVIKLTDTPATTAWADFGILGVYEKGCTECTTEVIEINTGQVDRLPSLVSSALVANPDITYVQAQFDQFLPSVKQAIQSAARDDVTVVSVDGLLSTLQDIEGGSPIEAGIGYNKTALAWYMADAVVRLTAGEAAVENLDFPFRRVFTTGNVGELTLDADAEASGAWFGEADYRSGFLELWGVDAP